MGGSRHDADHLLQNLARQHLLPLQATGGFVENGAELLDGALFTLHQGQNVRRAFGDLFLRGLHDLVAAVRGEIFPRKLIQRALGRSVAKLKEFAAQILVGAGLQRIEDLVVSWQSRHAHLTHARHHERRGVKFRFVCACCLQHNQHYPHNANAMSFARHLRSVRSR